MNKKQDQKATMIDNSLAVLARNLTTLNPVVNFTTYFTELNANASKMRGLTGLQQLKINGNSEDKKQMKAKLIPFIIEGCNRLTALSVASSNNVLMKEIDFPRSELKKKSGTKLKDAAQAVFDRIQTNLAAMAPYGANATTQAAFQAAINAFVVAARKPKVARNLQKVTTQRVDESIRQAGNSLTKIDSLINMLILQQPDLYEEYWSARKLEKVGTRYASVVCRVSDAQSHDAIKGVMVSFILDSNSINYKEGATTMSKKSAQKGGFIIKNMPAGIYQVIAKKDGFKELRMTIVVNDGELTRVKIEMSKLILL